MNTIKWMADETIAQTHPGNWNRVGEASRTLFSLIGNPSFTHEVVVPQTCIGSLAKQLWAQKFSAIIDLTGGWLSESLKEIFPITPVIRDFHLSRVRDVSDPLLHTTGHIISVEHTRIQTLKHAFDLSHPLIIDDVSFSGLSSEVAMRMFGVNPTNTTHGFLILNEGDLGKEPGARNRLESSGSHVFGGHSMNTSEGDDGWHIKDFIAHGQLELLLGAALMVQELFEQDGKDSSIVQRLFRNEAMRKIFFPHAIGVSDLKRLHDEGLFIPNAQHEPSIDSIHTTNPSLLISPYVLRHISSKQMREHFDEVTDLMVEIHNLSFDSEVRNEAIQGLRDHVSQAVEGDVIFERKESCL